MHVANQVVAFSMYIQDGYSPLHNASQEGHDGIVERLLQTGATVDLQTKVRIDVTQSFSPTESSLKEISQHLAFLRESGPRLPSSFMLGHTLFM